MTWGPIFLYRVAFITAASGKRVLDVFGDVAIGLQLLKGNCGSRMGLGTVAQSYVGAAALVGWQEQAESPQPGKNVVPGCPLVILGTTRS